MNSTMCLLVNIPTLLLLYVIIYFTQNLSGKRQFYGISLNSDYFTNRQFKTLDIRFKLFVTIGFIISTVVALICIYVFKAYTFASIGPILGFSLYQFGVYIYIHNKVKNLKKELSLNVHDIDIEKTKVIFDTEFINEKNRIIKKFSLLFFIPVVVLILIGMYGISQYNSIPDTIPTHWGPSGAADAFTEKSFIKVISQIFMNIGIAIVVSITCVGSLKSRIKLSVDNISDSKKSNLYYLNKFAIAFFVLNLSTQVMFMTILIATINASNVNPIIIWGCTIVIIIISLYLTYFYYKSPSKGKNAVYSVDDDDSLWILGTFYNNPNDASLFVQKRFGVGWTINIGTTNGKLLLAAPFLLTLLSLMFI